MDNEDFFQQYRATNNKLKKRFLKKPNVAEACEDFGNLSRQLKQKGCPQYAGYCCIAKARCEEQMLTYNEEVKSLLQAARYFKEADQNLEHSACPNFREHLENAEELYCQVIKKLSQHKKNPRASSVSFEFANYLFGLRKYAEALQYYKQSVNLISEISSTSIKVRQKIIYCQIYLKEYTSAIKSAFALRDFIKTHTCRHSDEKTALVFFDDESKECELTCLLLLLKVNQPFDFMSVEHKDFVNQYKMDWKNLDENFKISSSNSFISDDLHLILMSLVEAFYDEDFVEIKSLHSKLRCHLTHEQAYLLELIGKE